MNIKRIVKISMFAVITYIAGLFQLPLGPVPITMQTAIVNISAVVLSPVDALLAMVIHMVLKLLFNGVGIIAMPSFGFIIGFAIAGFLGSLFFSKSEKTNRDFIIAILITSITPYILGLPYMAYVLNNINGANMNLIQIMKAGFLIFIPGDLIKAFISYLIGIRIRPALNSFQ